MLPPAASRELENRCHINRTKNGSGQKAVVGRGKKVNPADLNGKITG